MPRPINEQTARTSHVEEGGARVDEQDLRCDEELVLNVYEMFRELNRCKEIIRWILNRV